MSENKCYAGRNQSILMPSIEQKIFNETIIFLGADVTHTPAGDSG